MTRSRWPLAILAAIVLTAGSRDAAAQTVIVRGAPAGASIDVVFNETAAGSGKASQTGEATVAFPLPPAKREIDAIVFLDACGDTRRFVIVERGQPAASAAAGCDRQQVQGLYLVRRSSNLLFNLSGPTPTLMLLQRPLGAGPSGWSPAERGLSLFAGGGLAKFSDARLVACGNVSNCSGGGFTSGFTAGADIWLTKFLGAEAGYQQTSKAKVSGSGTGFRFDTSVDSQMAYVHGKVGIPLGPVRLYGRVGGNYHYTTAATTQTIDDVTVTVDDQPVVLTGGTQTTTLETKGWSWGFGGGMEMWFKSWLGVYGDVGRASLKGDQVGGGEGIIDDAATTIVFGARFRIGG